MHTFGGLRVRWCLLTAVGSRRLVSELVEILLVKIFFLLPLVPIALLPLATYQNASLMASLEPFSQGKAPEVLSLGCFHNITIFYRYVSLCIRFL